MTAPTSPAGTTPTTVRRAAYVSVDPGVDPGVPVFGRKGSSVHVQAVLRELVRAGVEDTRRAARLMGDVPADLAGVAVVPDVLDADLAAPHRHVDGVRRAGARGRRARPRVVPDDVGSRAVEEDGAGRARPAALPDRDRRARERAALPDGRDRELQRLRGVGDRDEQRVRRTHGPSGERLRRGDDALGEELAAVGDPAAAPVAVPGERGPPGAGRGHVEHVEHPGEGRTGHGRTPVKTPAPSVTPTASRSNATCPASRATCGNGSG